MGRRLPVPLPGIQRRRPDGHPWNPARRKRPGGQSKRFEDSVHHRRGERSHRDLMDSRPINPGPWRWAIIQSDLTPLEKHVALTIGVRFNPKGEIPESFRVGSRRLAQDCSRRRETVLKAIDNLVEAGWLGVDKGKGTKASRYWATLPLAVQEAVPQELQEDSLAVSQNGASGTGTGSLAVQEAVPNQHSSALDQHPEKFRKYEELRAAGVSAKHALAQAFGESA